MRIIKINKISMVFFACFLIIFALTITSSVQAKRMFIASAFEGDHILNEMGYKFKELIEEYTDGEIEVEMSIGGAAGGEMELMEQTSIGSIDGTLSNPEYFYAEEYYWYCSPFILKSASALENFWNSDIAEDMQKRVIENGNMRTMNKIYRGMRHTTSNKPFYTPEDFAEANIKLRLPNIPVWFEIWERFNPDIVTTDISELFTAMQMGVADATEGEAIQILTAHLYEVQEYLILTSHMPASGSLLINEDYYQNLTEEEKKLVEKASKEAGEWASVRQIDIENKQIVDLQKKGLKVIVPNVKDFVELAKPAIKKLFDKVWEGNYEDIEKQYIDVY
jgi:TRAP-type transport system periplasmic protein